ncbi:hypothetical protein M0638_06260 [Roseomonas sp. NAR14]|uniref:Uncharacterized protein n=1 Tax=Roseomonas acroporae TaxID=2937791 RepID=A0A9X1Y6E6_9PROT|nr:hypothetical protein [Roseomonas acroporae]MCK8783982.1 hypothetical protein [Roseomonas acroporae]
MRPLPAWLLSGLIVFAVAAQAQGLPGKPPALDSPAGAPPQATPGGKPQALSGGAAMPAPPSAGPSQALPPPNPPSQAAPPAPPAAQAGAPGTAPRRCAPPLQQGCMGMQASCQMACPTTWGGPTAAWTEDRPACLARCNNRYTMCLVQYGCM